jgi:hypothetical protein
MRIFFITGLGEEKFIFDKIENTIAGEKIFIDNWSELNDVPQKDLTAFVYAARLVKHFKIKPEDVVIGHSLGAWVAIWIKEIVRCKIVQIAGWTDTKKVTKVSPSLDLLYLFAKKGWGFNKFVRFLLLVFYYKKASKHILLAIFDKLKRSDKLIVAKQLMIVYNPVSQPLSVIPDLRIHSRPDMIVAPPDEPFIVMRGDHFGLYTFPETVYKPIKEFLKQ